MVLAHESMGEFSFITECSLHFDEALFYARGQRVLAVSMLLAHVVSGGATTWDQYEQNLTEEKIFKHKI